MTVVVVVCTYMFSWLFQYFTQIKQYKLKIKINTKSAKLDKRRPSYFQFTGLLLYKIIFWYNKLIIWFLRILLNYLILIFIRTSFYEQNRNKSNLDNVLMKTDPMQTIDSCRRTWATNVKCVRPVHSKFMKATVWNYVLVAMFSRYRVRPMCDYTILSDVNILVLTYNFFFRLSTTF